MLGGQASLLRVSNDRPDTFFEKRIIALLLVRRQLHVCNGFEGETGSEDADGEGLDDRVVACHYAALMAERRCKWQSDDGLEDRFGEVGINQGLYESESALLRERSS